MTFKGFKVQYKKKYLLIYQSCDFNLGVYLISKLNSNSSP